MNEPLPQGWARTALGDVCSVEYGKGLPKRQRVEAGSVGVYGSAGLVGRHDRALVDKPVVIVGRKGNAGAVWHSEEPAWPIDTTYFLRVPSGVCAKYLGMQLGHLDLVEHDSSTTIPSLRRPDLEAVSVTVAPSEEQRRIVAVIEEHFSRLDAASDAITIAEAKIEASRRSVLAEAFAGRLVLQDPSDEAASALLDRIAPGRRTEPANRRIHPGPSHVSGDLSPGWTWARLEDLAAAEPRAITDGPFGSNLKTAHYTDSGPRVIRLQNIGDGAFRREDAHISDEHYLSLVQHSVREGDLIVASLGETLPRACLVPSWVPPAIVKADCIRVRLHPELNSAYVNLALRHPGLRHLTSTEIRGVGRPRLGLKGIRNLAQIFQ